MQAENQRVAYVSAIQGAFMDAVVDAKKRSKLFRLVVNSINRNKLRQERAISINLSYRTAQKLKHEGAI